MSPTMYSGLHDPGEKRIFSPFLSNHSAYSHKANLTKKRARSYYFFFFRIMGPKPGSLWGAGHVKT